MLDQELQSCVDYSLFKKPQSLDQYFYGHGKVLLFGEYFLLDGAKSLAIPTKVGQSLSVKYESTYDPHLHWKSYDVNGNVWFEDRFEFWRFTSIERKDCPISSFLQKLLLQARNQNAHFLRDDVDVYVETKLGFPIDWGLGSSSTLIYNVAQWAYVSPFELQFNVLGGSGYDIACAQSEGPIIYSKEKKGPNWSPVQFRPSFYENIYFIFLGNKFDTRKGIEHYNSLDINKKVICHEITEITHEVLNVKELIEFEHLVTEHEKIISSSLGLDSIKEQRFDDYWGAIKSLGAWGGDLALVTSDRSFDETYEYFKNKGYPILIPYKKLVALEKRSDLDNERILH